MYFVTGGTGLLGNNIVRELCAQGLPVRVLCRPGSPRTPFDGLTVEIIEGELNQPEVLDAGSVGCTAVFHCAAMIHLGWTQLEESRRVNVQGTQNVVDACVRHGCRLIHVSTVDTLPSAGAHSVPIDERGLNGVPKVPCSYVVSKTEAEQVVRDAIDKQQLDAVIVHPGFMLGPYDWKPSSGRMFLQVTQAPIVAGPPGGCSLCDAREVAKACVNAIDQGAPGENYILAGENLRFRELWRRMLRIAGIRKPVLRLGKRARWGGVVIDWVNRRFSLAERDVNGATLAMANLYHYYDSTKAQRALGYNPQLTDERLAETWEWLRKQHLEHSNSSRLA
mgnify:CR=1 FL=1